MLRQGRVGAITAAIALTVAAPGSAQAAELLGDWAFDEPEGQLAIDAGPFGLDGRLGESDAADAADPLRVPGRSGGALRFDGRSFVRLPDSERTAPDTVAVEAVVRAPVSPGAHAYIVARGSYECLAGSFGLYTAANGGAAFYVFDGERYHLTAAAAAADVWDGEWHHLMGTFDGSELRLYLDGSPVGRPGRAPSHIDYGRLTTPSTYFGTYVSDTCRLPFAGDLDHLRLWGDRPAFVEGPPVPAERPPRTLEAPVPPSGRAAEPDPGAPPRACRLRAVKRRAPAGRWAVTVHMRVRGAPVKGVLVSVRRNGRPHARARTDARGRARFKLRVRRSARLRAHAVYSPRCAPVRIR